MSVSVPQVPPAVDTPSITPGNDSKYRILRAPDFFTMSQPSQARIPGKFREIVGVHDDVANSKAREGTVATAAGS